ncbi:hypothetical protein ABBQ38_010478 [Trebouxia sp. C0009 RCD-2024]
MARLPNTKQAASGVGFLGVAAVVTMHKAVSIAERARHKPDKAAHERVMIWVDNVRKVAVRLQCPTSRFRNISLTPTTSGCRQERSGTDTKPQEQQEIQIVECQTICTRSTRGRLR